jgi:predicted GH43/DUF377 family glycosyl hydrolase
MRDIRLLLEALEKNPENLRNWFVLAQSYRDAGHMAEAAKAFARRAEMGGCEAEAWNARLSEARCLRHLGDEGGFLRSALAAFNQQPHCAEPLYDLARHYREKGMHEASLLFSEPALTLERPKDDNLFVEDFVYRCGLKEEFSISANYSRDANRRDRGFAACNWLALSREVPTTSRALARSNIFFYLEPAAAMLRSYTARPVEFAAPEGYRLTNPSVATFGDQILLAQRAVNYMGDDGECRTADGSAVRTRNFLLRLDHELVTRSSDEIMPPTDMPEPAYDLVLGFEDLRIFHWRGSLWGSACLRQMNAEGWCEQVLARINDRGASHCRLSDCRVLRPDGLRLHERNWMPRIDGDVLQFIYLCDPTLVVDENAHIISSEIPVVAADQFSGGSQAIAFNEGWLVLVHEVRRGANFAKTAYQHRFVWFDRANRLRRLSRPFYFNQKGIEFAAGLAWHPDGERLLVSYGVGDQEAFIGTVNAAEVIEVLEFAEHLPSGA